MISKFFSSPSHNIRYILFFLAGFLVFVAAGIPEKTPGYMDAEYYYASSIQLADGKGFYQPFLWNYLDNASGVPAPANTFWMPLVSLFSLPGYALFRTFTGARLLLLVAAALVPPMTVGMGVKLHGNNNLAMVGGLFALFPAYYLAYLATTDAFALYMLLGSLFLLVAAQIQSRSAVSLLVLGILAGLLHMTRADGILWLAGGIVWLSVRMLKSEGSTNDRMITLLAGVGLCVAGYLVITSPWYLRNAMVFGSLFPPGGSKTLWLTQYEDLFVFPAQQLTFTRWFAMGWTRIISVWGQAAWTNTQTSVAVQGSIALSPFILVGLLKLRRKPIVQLGTGMWLATLLVFSFIFPFQGMNGSFFHSAAAFQPLFWALAPVGVAAAVDYVARLRKWQRGAQVQRFVNILLVIVCVMLSAGLYSQKVLGIGDEPAWGTGLAQYSQADRALTDLGATPCELVMVNNPPGYYLASGRSAVVIPYGDEKMLLEAAIKYSVQYLIVDKNNAGHLPRLYLEPGAYPGFIYLTNVGDLRIYEFDY